MTEKSRLVLHKVKSVNCWKFRPKDRITVVNKKKYIFHVKRLELSKYGFLAEKRNLRLRNHRARLPVFIFFAKSGLSVKRYRDDRQCSYCYLWFTKTLQLKFQIKMFVINLSSKIKSKLMRSHQNKMCNLFRPLIDENNTKTESEET